MDMKAFGGCWDCPVQLVPILGYYVLFIVLAVIGARLLRAQSERWRIIGGLILFFVLLFALGFTRVVPNWGIVPLKTRAQDFALLLSLDAVLLATIVCVRWWPSLKRR